jgi:hypothetical protein
VLSYDPTTPGEVKSLLALVDYPAGMVDLRNYLDWFSAYFSVVGYTPINTTFLKFLVADEVGAQSRDGDSSGSKALPVPFLGSR